MTDLANAAKKHQLIHITLAILLVILLIGLVWSYMHARANAISKTSPYSVEMQLTTDLDSTLTVLYDYGYGFNTGHQRQVTLQGSDHSQFVRFSISAWKTLKGLSLSGLGEANATLQSITVKQANKHFQIEFDETTNIPNGSNLVIDDLDLKMESI